MAIKIKIKCDICGEVSEDQIKYVGEVPKGWYVLRYQPKSMLLAVLHICSDECLKKYSIRNEGFDLIDGKKKNNGGK